MVVCNIIFYMFEILNNENSFHFIWAIKKKNTQIYVEKYKSKAYRCYKAWGH